MLKIKSPSCTAFQRGISAEIGTASDQIFGYGGFPKMVGFPNKSHGFVLLKMILLGCEMGIPPFKETHIWLDDGGQKHNKQIKRTDP